MPMSGPEDHVIKSEITRSGPDYGLVKLTPTVVDILKEYGPGAIAGSFPDHRPPPSIKFGIGDVVAVSIFEAAAGGLFIPAEAGVRPGNFVSLPNQNVNSAGFITVPYAGAIKAAGRTPSEIQQDIVKDIGNRAIEPQVVVSLITQNTSLISVLGEVNAPTRLTANAAGERILDVIARAGGPKGQGWETWVTLERAGKRATVPFGALVYQPSNNIWVHPGDTIYVYREPQIFLAFGASGSQGQFPFDMWKISMTQAMAKAGGLLDAQAEPSWCLCLPSRATGAWPKGWVSIAPSSSGRRFQWSTTSTSGTLLDIFLATKFEMRDKDVLFAANAATVDTAKFLQFVRVVIATANDTLVTASNAQIVKIQSRL